MRCSSSCTSRSSISFYEDDRFAYIFETFCQTDNSVMRKNGGSGLGLTITKRLAVILGGDVQLSSTPGKGAVFSLIVPARTELESQPLLDDNNIKISNRKTPQKKQQKRQNAPAMQTTCRTAKGEVIRYARRRFELPAGRKKQNEIH